MTKRRLWVYKCNSRGEEYQSGVGDWRDFFDEPDDGEWGGEWSTKNPESLKIIREKLRPGHYILCYQTDRREVVGTCQLVRFVETPKGPKKGRNLCLKPVEEFHPPVKIHDLKRILPSLRMVRALQPGPPKTLYEVSDREAKHLLSACGARLQIPIVRSKKKSSASK